MDALAELLEADLAEAFEVKNRASLHRYVTLLVQGLAGRETNEKEHSAFRETIIRIDTRIEEGFKRMDERFESMQRSMDERFGAVQHSMDQRFQSVDRRFEDINRRFTMMFSFMSIGFVALATLITVFQLVG